jgi:hypothetical protein
MLGVYAFAGILLLLLLVVVLSAFRESDGGPEPGRLRTAAERRDTAIEALRQLEFEHQTGKMPEAEYRELHRRLAQEAVRARAAAAAESPGETGSAEGTVGGDSCAVCGAALAPSDHFCSSCGSAADGEHTDTN